MSATTIVMNSEGFYYAVDRFVPESSSESMQAAAAVFAAGAWRMLAKHAHCRHPLTDNIQLHPGQIVSAAVLALEEINILKALQFSDDEISRMSVFHASRMTRDIVTLFTQLAILVEQDLFVDEDPEPEIDIPDFGGF